MGPSTTPCSTRSTMTRRSMAAGRPSSRSAAERCSPRPTTATSAPNSACTTPRRCSRPGGPAPRAWSFNGSSAARSIRTSTGTRRPHRLTCVQNVIEGRGWRLDVLDLDRALADGRATGPGVRVRTFTFDPHDELEGYWPLDARAIADRHLGPSRQHHAGRHPPDRPAPLAARPPLSVPLIADAALAMMAPGFRRPGLRRQNGDNLRTTASHPASLTPTTTDSVPARLAWSSTAWAAALTSCARHRGPRGRGPRSPCPCCPAMKVPARSCRPRAGATGPPPSKRPMMIWPPRGAPSSSSDSRPAGPWRCTSRDGGRWPAQVLLAPFLAIRFSHLIPWGRRPTSGTSPG